MSIKRSLEVTTQQNFLKMLIEDKIIRIYCIVDDILKGIGHQEDVRRKVSDSEIITQPYYQFFILEAILTMGAVL